MASSASKIRPMIAAGYGSRAVVYIIVGVFALLAASGDRSDVIGPEGALGWVLNTGFGGLVLFALGLGLFCYAVWRVVQAL
ncbi:MAG: DUF1206 domain-containing protein, partial [Alphaproteobacteria bacterium]|nr:DUF1206 domain-containing protein [Alphaproteobacteria bacterium]